MVTKEFAEVCTEINQIFSLISKEELNKIPKELREKFKKCESKSYITNIDTTKSIDEQQLKQKTKDILVTLYIKYWCKENEREEINKILKENYIKEQEKLREKHNPDEIFKKTKTNNNEISNIMLGEYKQNIFKKIINKIKKYIIQNK